MSNITISNDVNTKNQTPIEIALQVDAEGKTTARKLYEFLELDKTQFARWCKTNIINNTFADAGTDYLRFDIDVETPTGGIVKRDDYTLTASFAKKLAMGCQNKRGEQARDYFIKVEDKLKQVAQKAPQLISDLERTKIEAQKARAEAMLLNAKNRTYKTLMSSIDGKNLSPIAVQVFGLKGLESTFGVEVDNYLPEVAKTYSATEIGKILGISANMVGRIAKANNLQTKEYGIMVMGKAQHNSSDRQTFRYFENAIPVFKDILQHVHTVQ